MFESARHFQVNVDLLVEEALQELKKEEYDTIVSGYHLLGKDGLQFPKELRGEGNNIPSVMFTGKGKEEAAVER